MISKRIQLTGLKENLNKQMNKMIMQNIKKSIKYTNPEKYSNLNEKFNITNKKLNLMFG
jgi:hypothetical protein